MVEKFINLFYTLQSKNKFKTIAIFAIIAMEFFVTGVVYIYRVEQHHLFI